MNHEQIDTFLAVVYNGSFCQAAKALYMSQPAVTHRIKTLEAELGTPLFIRNNPRLILTSAGAAFVQEAQALQVAFQHARTAMLAYHERSNTLVIGFPEVMLQGACQAFISIMQRSTALSPLLLQSLLLDKPPYYHQKLLSGEADLIFTDVGLPEVASDAFCRQRLFAGQAYICVHKDHPLATRKHLLKSDLSGRTLYRYPDSTCFNDQFYLLLQNHSICVQQQEATSFSDALAHISHKDGLVPSNLRLIQSPTITYLPLADAAFDVGIVWLKKNETPALLKLVQFICDLPADTWRV